MVGGGFFLMLQRVEPHVIALGLPQHVEELREGEGKGREGEGRVGESAAAGRKRAERERAAAGRRVRGLGLGTVGGGQCKSASRGSLQK